MNSIHHKLLLLSLLFFYQCSVFVEAKSQDALHDVSIQQVLDDDDDWLSYHEVLSFITPGFNAYHSPDAFVIELQNSPVTSIRTPPQLLI